MKGVTQSESECVVKGDLLILILIYIKKTSMKDFFNEKFEFYDV